MMPTSPESAGATVEKTEPATANELDGVDTAPTEAELTTPAVNDDKAGSFKSTDVVELGGAQPIAGGALSDAGPETEHEQPVPEAGGAVDDGVMEWPAALGAVEKACAGEVAFTSTESAGVEAEQVEIATAVELAQGNTDAPAMPDAEAQAPAPEGYVSPAAELVSPDIAVEDAAPKGGGQSLAEKKRKNNFGLLLPKLLGWDKKKPNPGAASIESATQAGAGEEAAGKPPVSTAAGGLEGQELAAHGGGPATTAMASLAAAEVDLEKPALTKKNHAGGFSLPKLLGWVKQAKPPVIDDVSTKGADNPPVAAVDAMGSAEGVPGAIRGVPGATKTAADERAPGDVGEAEVTSAREPGSPKVRIGPGLDLEECAISQRDVKNCRPLFEALRHGPLC